ncbi:putative solute-binding protein [Methyloprofundus sp.]|uniref:putative solute-binding protein n=1 Tax=Methyloprofundus sp. TaxID=2020875 RepID=UPI003D1022B2
MKRRIDYFSRVLLFALLISSNFVVLADKKNLCVFDLLGANGPIYAQMKDYQIAALDWGVELQLKPYISEVQAAKDLSTGLCDAASFTGIQARHFNYFTGTLDAMGALPSYTHLKTIISTISTPRAAPLMIHEPYEVAGIIPMGAAYLFVNDRSLLRLYADAQGSHSDIRIAVMDNDPAQTELVSLLGTPSLSSSIAEMYTKFNTGQVDVSYGPAVVYQAMELHKGLQENGGVIRFPVAQLSLQIIIRRAAFPHTFGQKSREYALSQFDKAVLLAQGYEDRIPAQRWLSISADNKERYHDIYRKTRISLRDKGVYDARMLRVMRLARCQQDPQLAECSAKNRE